MQQPVILISGASRGIGLAAAQQLSARGALVLVASRRFDRAQQAAAAMGGAATALQLDVTDECSIALAVSEVAARCVGEQCRCLARPPREYFPTETRGLE